MDKTTRIGNVQTKRMNTNLPLGFLLVGLLLVSLLAMQETGCKGAPPEEKPADKMAMSIAAYWKSLFKDDPAKEAEFERIQAEFRAGKHSLALTEMKELLNGSPEAPWVEAVEFTMAQAWMVLRQSAPGRAGLGSSQPVV